MNKICVVGSLNVDLTFVLNHFHAPGETIIANSMDIFTGGKGGNQTVACARLGADVTMIGCLGDDANGELYMATLKKEGADVRGITVLEGVPSGVAIIEVDERGENRIIVASGTNHAITPDMVTDKADCIRAADVCLFQLETPLVVVNHAMALARQAGALVVLDPAPAPKTPIPEAIYMLCDYVTPNESELALLSGMPVGTIEEAVLAAQSLIKRGVRAVINKRGGQGALLVTRDGYKLFPGFKVEVVDTTAAGDSFNAGLAVGLARGYAIEDAIVFANAVGALSTTAAGAQPAMPSFDAAASLVATAED